MFGISKKKKVEHVSETTMGVGFKGNEVNVNPSAEKKRERNKARLSRVRSVMADLKKRGAD